MLETGYAIVCEYQLPERSPAQLFDHVGIICLSLFLDIATFIWCLEEEGTTKPLWFMVEISSIKEVLLDDRTFTKNDVINVTEASET